MSEKSMLTIKSYYRHHRMPDSFPAFLYTHKKAAATTFRRSYEHDPVMDYLARFLMSTRTHKRKQKIVNFFFVDDDYELWTKSTPHKFENRNYCFSILTIDNRTFEIRWGEGYDHSRLQILDINDMDNNKAATYDDFSALMVKILSIPMCLATPQQRTTLDKLVLNAAFGRTACSHHA